MMRLNIGSGKFPLKYYKNIDIDPIVDPDECYDVTTGIRESPESVDELLLSHVLMYLKEAQVRSLLKDCFKVLKKDGTIRITEDNKHLKVRNEEQLRQYKGGKLFDSTEMEELMREAGFTNVRVSKPFGGTRHHLELPETYTLAKGLSSVYFLKGNKNVTGSKTVYLALDDFGEQVSTMDILWKLRKHFDDFKANLFAPLMWNEREEWLKYVNSLGWLQLCVHGYNHVRDEDIDEVSLGHIANNKYFSKIYKAPFWELSDEMYARLKKNGFKILLHKDDEREGCKYNWEINSLPPEAKITHGYGHIYPHDYKSVNENVGSSLFHNYENVLKLPKNTDFKFY